MKSNYHQDALNKYGSPLTADQFNEFVESVITASQSSPGKYWREVDAVKEPPVEDDVYSVISAGYSHPVERRYILNEKRWCYPYEKGADLLYDNHVTHYLLPTDHQGGYTVEEMERAWEAFRMKGFPHNTDGYGHETFKQFIQSLK